MPIRRTHRKKKSTSSRRKSKSQKSSSRKSRGAAVYYKPTRTIQRGYLPFGQSFLVKLPYVFSSTLSTATSSFVAVGHTFRLNSLYDPDQSGLGKQPYQFDQLNTIYSRYRVHGAKVSITWNNPSADGLYLGYHVRSIHDSFTPVGKNADYIREIAKGKMQPLNDTGSQTMTQSFYVPVGTVFGVSKEIVRSDISYSSGVGGNPLNTVYLDVLALDSTGSTSKSAQFSIKITYYAVLSERKVQAQS